MPVVKVRPIFVLLGLLGGLLVGSLYWLALRPSTGRMKSQDASMTEPWQAGADYVDVEQVARAVGRDGLLAMHIDYFRRQTGRYPHDLAEVATPPQPSANSKWRGPFLNNPALMEDPWGRRYLYETPGTHNPASYDLWSMGADGISGTSDDVGNW
jgi:type II secretion system protein G